MSSRCLEKRSITPRFCATAALLILLVLQGPALALPDDQQQPIHISADTAIRDERQGFTVYSGNVQMNQGSMHIEADKITIYHMNEEADKIVAEGKPAKMRQRPDLEKGPVHARAGIIEYFKNEDRVRLETDARIEQDGGMVTGDSIEYFISEQLVKADSDTSVEGNRVIVVIPPSLQQPAPAVLNEEPVQLDPAQQESETPAITAPESAESPTDTPAGTETQQEEEVGSGATDSE